MPQTTAQPRRFRRWRRRGRSACVVRFDSKWRSWWILRMLPFSPEKGTTGKLTIGDSDFGGPADSGSPVALRPPLARGLPFRFVTEDTYRFTGSSQ